MKHRVKVTYVAEIEAADQKEALIRAAEMLAVNQTTTNIHMECWTPKQKTESPAGESTADTAEVETAA